MGLRTLGRTIMIMECLGSRSTWVRLLSKRYTHDATHPKSFLLRKPLVCRKNLRTVVRYWLFIRNVLWFPPLVTSPTCAGAPTRGPVHQLHDRRLFPRSTI